jgi:peptidoglycan/xylan/chitin deacetylase (PgdA/CDA1 family)
MKRAFVLCLLLSASSLAGALPRPIELHQRLDLPPQLDTKTVALTLDACGGAFDEHLIGFLIEHRVPATIFTTKRWLDRNPVGAAELAAHDDLFEIEDHGADHIPAVIGAGRRVFGIRGEPDVAHLQREIVGGAQAVRQLNGYAPRWYRGATAEYDPSAIKLIRAMGYQIAGFSVNADGGATLHRNAIVARLKAVRGGDIIIAHMNKPTSDTAQGLADGLTWLLAQGFRFVTLNESTVHDLPS